MILAVCTAFPLFPGSPDIDVAPQVGHPGWIQQIVMSRDHRYVLSGAMDQSIRLRDVASRREIVRPIGTGNGDYLTIAPDGYYAASADMGSCIAVIQGMEVSLAGDLSAVFDRLDLIKSRLDGAGSAVTP